MGAGSSQRTDAGKSWVVPSAATEGGVAVAVTEWAAQLQSKPRASEHEASAYSRQVREPRMGRTILRVLSASPTLRVPRLADAVVWICVVAPEHLRSRRARPSRTDIASVEGRQE